MTHGPTCQVRSHTRRNLASPRARGFDAVCFISCAAIFSLRERFFLFSFSFLSFLRIRVSRRGTLFQKQSDSATILYESTCVEKGNDEKVIKFSRLIIPFIHPRSVLSRVTNLLRLTRRKHWRRKRRSQIWRSLSNICYNVARVI